MHRHSAKIFLTLGALPKGGLTIVLVEQNVRLAMAISDFTHVFAEGRISFCGKPEDLAKMDKGRQAYLGL